MSTLVVVQCYAGDAHQVHDLLPSWQKHGFPVLLLSPETAPVQVDAPGVECRSAGEHGWSGYHTIARQIEHFRIMATYPYEHILYHDADSIVLPDTIPEYLYEQDVFWSNERDSYNFLTRIEELANGSSMEERDVQVREASKYLFESSALQGTSVDEMHERAPGVYQPPYFFSQRVLAQMIKHAPDTVSSEDFLIPFIDWFYAALCKHGEIPHANFLDGISLPAEQEYWRKVFLNMLSKRQVRMAHSIKTAETAKIFEDAYRVLWGDK